MVTVIEQLFPGLLRSSYQMTSPEDDVYNCIAWAAGQTSRWWWPSDAPGNYWPAGVTKEETLPAFEELFLSLGYGACATSDREAGHEKIAIFADALGFPTHAARQLPDGRWTSKLGKLQDIAHELAGLVGVEYGSAVVFMRRPAALLPNSGASAE